MKNFRNSIKKLSEAQIKKLSLIISAIIASVFFILVAFAYIITEEDIISFLVALVPTILLFLWLYLFFYLLFGGREKKYVIYANEAK